MAWGADAVGPGVGASVLASGAVGAWANAFAAKAVNSTAEVLLSPGLSLGVGFSLGLESSFVWSRESVVDSLAASGDGFSRRVRPITGDSEEGTGVSAFAVSTALTACDVFACSAVVAVFALLATLTALAVATFVAVTGCCWLTFGG